MSDRERDALIQELQAIPKPERLDYLARLPEERQRAFKRILPPDDIRKLNDAITRAKTKPKVMTTEAWLAEARAGKATSVDAMIGVLREIEARLRPQDLQWISRIEETAKGRSFSRKQAAVIERMYRRYFRDDAVS